MIDITSQLKQKIIEKYAYTCQKCGYKNESGEEIEVHVIPKTFKDINYSEDKLTVLCKICNMFAPKEEKYLKSYIAEKIPWEMLETFRKAGKSTSKRTKKGMEKARSVGKIVHRPPLGYTVVDGKMVVNEAEMEKVRNIFADYKTGMGIREIARKYGLSAPGIKKVLENKVYSE
jgi:hypothetical protein